MALKHLALALLFAFVGCKKPDKRDEAAPVATETMTAAKGSPQTGPGFTVVAASAATVSKGRLSDGQPEEDVYTFNSAGTETYEVRIHPVTADQNGLQAASLVRDKIVFTAAVKLNEDDVADGKVRGFDLTYKTDDDVHLYARSKVVADEKNVFHVRALYPKKDQEDAANAFVDSFAINN
ncbi:MAG TPA: hypothetical protein VGM90_41070 [Kofleriaceae bacterium]|jgi:hypothetical protein